MKRKQYYEGQKLGNLIFIKDLEDRVQPNGKSKRMALMKCDCGTEFKTNLYSAISKSVNNCKKCAGEISGAKNIKHGLVKNNNPVYWIWSDIKRRCYNKKCSSYSNYGLKGITMQENWINDVGLFFNYISNLPNFDVNNLGMGGLTIDRIDCFAGYKEGNLRWVNATMQNINKPLQKNNKTGYRGISKRTNGTYQVTIRYKRKSNYIGTFKDIETAIKKRKIFLDSIELYNEYTKYE